MQNVLDGLTKIQMASIVTSVVSGLGLGIEQLGDVWGFAGVAGQISETCAIVVMLSSGLLGGATIGKYAVKKAIAKDGEA